MESNPLISIILAVYNTQSYLPQCLKSILEQTYQHWELLLMDDGSNDGSEVISDQCAASDVRVTVVHKENTGKADCCNKALRMAKGEWICFVDSDDWLETNALEVLLQTVLQTGKQVAIGGHVDEYVNTSVASPVCKQLSVKELGETIELFYNRQIYSCLWGKLFHRGLFQEPIPNLVEHEDHAVLYKWLSHGNGAVLCPQILYHYRQRRSSIMGQHLQNDMFQLVPVIEECYHYIRQRQLLSESRNKQIAVQQFVNIAKGIARKGRWMDEETMAKLQDIRDCLTRLQPVNPCDIGVKSYRRMSFLLKSPAKFLLLMKMGAIFVSRKPCRQVFYA